MSFADHALAVAGAFSWAPGAGFGMPTGPCVDARGVVTYSPWAMARSAAAGGAAAEPAPAVGSDPEGADGLGLAPDRNSENPVRNGLRGLTGFGRKQVRRGCALLEADRACLGFWTVTLPPAAMAEVQRLDCWDRFQNALRHRLVELLQRAGLPPLVVGVAELHPERSRREGRPCPHLHIAFLAKRNRWHCWALDRWRLDAAIRQALGRCGIVGVDVSAAGKLVGVRKSVGRYLSKYMTKEGPLAGVWGRTFQGMPRQWWFMSRPLLRRVVETTIPIPDGFLGWLHEHREALALSGALRCGCVDRLPPRAPAVFWIAWSDAGPLLDLWRAWQG